MFARAKRFVGNTAKNFSMRTVFSFLASLALCSLLIGVSISNNSEVEKMTMERRITEKAMDVDGVVSRLLYKAQVLAALVIRSDGGVEDFDHVAAAIVDDPAILNILIAPNGVISNVYPLEGNEETLGYNLLGAGEGNREALMAKEKGQLVFGGPFNLVQGGQALVGRYPVWLDADGGDKVFWGLVSVTLKYPDVLAGAGLDLLENDGLAYEIWRVNPDDGERQVIAQSRYYRNRRARFIEREFPIFNAEWFFRLSPVYEWYQYSENWMLIFAGFCISVMIAFITQNNCELKRMQSELESMVCVDPLTGVLNRKGLMYKLEKLIRANGRFVLYYIDLNYFKQINDTHGHNAGDIVLIEFCCRIRKHVSNGHFFARIGGDEFALVYVEDAASGESAESLWEGIDEEFSYPIRVWEGIDVLLTFSRGGAAFPEDGDNIDDLFLCADSEMYRQKNSKYAAEKRRRSSDWQLVTSAASR